MIIPYGFLEEAVNMQQFRKYVNDKGLGNCDAKQLYQEIVKLMRGGYNIPDKVALDAYGTSDSELKQACYVALELAQLEKEIEAKTEPQNDSWHIPRRIRLWEDKQEEDNGKNAPVPSGDLLVNDTRLGSDLQQILKELKPESERNTGKKQSGIQQIVKIIQGLTADNFNEQIKTLTKLLKERKQKLKNEGESDSDSSSRDYGTWKNNDAKKLRLIDALLSKDTQPNLLYKMTYNASDKDELRFRLQHILKLLKPTKEKYDSKMFNKHRMEDDEQMFDAENRRIAKNRQAENEANTAEGKRDKTFREFNRLHYRKGVVGVPSATQLASEKCRQEYKDNKETYDKYWDENHGNWRYNDFKYLDDDLRKVFNIADAELASSFEKVKPGIEKALEQARKQK